MRHRPLTHAQYVLVNRLAMPVMAFILLIVIGRHSDALLGQYALVMTYYFIMQMLPLLGLTSYVMREVAREPSQAGRYFASVGLMSMIGCVAVDAVCALLLPLARYPAEANHAIAIVGVLIFPGILLFIAELLFMSVHRARPIALVAVGENIARVALSVAALWLGFGLVALFWVFFATRLAALVAYLVCLRQMGIVPRWELPDPALLLRTTRMLPAFLVGTVLFAVFSRIDFVVLSFFEPVEVIGYYAIGYRPFEITIMLVTALLMAIFPWASRIYAHAPRRFRTTSRNVILSFAALVAVIATSGALLSQEYVYLLFTRQYPRPVALTELFMAAVALAGLDYVVSGLLHASDRQQADTRAMVFGGLAQLGLLFALIPSYGIYGAFAAKLAATLIQLVFKYVMMQRTFGALFSAGELLRLAVCGAALGAATYALLEAHWTVRVAAAVLLPVVALPGLALALGLFQPLRLLRYFARHRDAPDVATMRDLLDMAAADAREHARGRHTFDRRLLATLFYRVARYLHLNGRRRLAGVVTFSGGVATGARIDPESPTKPEWGAA